MTHTGPGWTLYQGNCLDVLPTLAAGSVDAVVTDPPYGTTACAWDSVIPLAPMWEQLRRVIKPSGAVVLFGSFPFTGALWASNPQWFKYAWVWDKRNVSNPQLAKIMPLKHHEDVLVFGGSTPTYNPQGLKPCKIKRRPDNAMGALGHLAQSKAYTQEWENYPTLMLQFPPESKTVHPTQKPVDLLRYLIRTYTNPDETVLDFTMGSGTTGVAAIMEGRCFIGVELDPGYYAIAHKRIANAQPPLFVADDPAQPTPEQAAMFDSESGVA
jgi:site-specific DNA-methyltransferase (adenine-specific)